jgi:8-amino-7-oxononanoate synthase
MRSISERLQSLKSSGNLRCLSMGSGVDLSSNDFLGLSQDPALRQALSEALQSGISLGSTGSRLLSGQCPEWQVLEQRFAAWQGRSASLFFATGYSANVGLLSSLVQPGDLVLSDALNHASIIDGLRLSKGRVQIIEHNDLGAFERALASSAKRAWIVVESVYSMDGDLAPLDGLCDLAERYDARLIVDEAHATGVFGEHGAGLCRALKHAPFATVHPCGKGMGLSGAFVCADESTIELLLNQARSFIYSTAPTPLLAPMLQASMERVQALGDARRRPLELAARLRRALHKKVDTGASQSQIVPIILGAAERALGAAESLAARGWLVRPIRPPSVAPGTCRLRLVMRSALHESQVDRLAQDLIDVA